MARPAEFEQDLAIVREKASIALFEPDDPAERRVYHTLGPGRFLSTRAVAVTLASLSSPNFKVRMSDISIPFSLPEDVVEWGKRSSDIMIYYPNRIIINNQEHKINHLILLSVFKDYIYLENEEMWLPQLDPGQTSISEGWALISPTPIRAEEWRYQQYLLESYQDSLGYAADNPFVVVTEDLSRALLNFMTYYTVTGKPLYQGIANRTATNVVIGDDIYDLELSGPDSDKFPLVTIRASHRKEINPKGGFSLSRVAVKV